MQLSITFVYKYHKDNNKMLDLSAPEKQIPLTTTKKLGNVEFSGYLKSHPQTAHLLFSIQKYLQDHPVFYLNSFLSSLKGISLDIIKIKLEEQYKALREGRSFLQVINNGIESRKRCINKIKRDITKSKPFLGLFPQQYFGQSEQDAAYLDWVQGQGYSVVDVDESVEQSIRVISNILADMARLREMTIYLVEQIHKWRIQIEEHLDRCQQHSQIQFCHEDKCFYQTVLEDSNFIWSSKLNQYIWMEAKNDPFIIRNVILVEQRPQKTLLEKYFLEIVYPKSEQTVDKAVKCFEFLVYKYKPKVYNRFEEEELLIENYLKMEMDAHQFDEPEQGFKISRVSQESPNSAQKARRPKEDNQSPSRKNQLNKRGWVFQKQLRKTHRDRINDIVQTHKQKMGTLKPYSISNYGQKNSIALAYLSETRKANKKERQVKVRKVSTYSDRSERNFMSEGEENKKKEKQYKRGIESQPQKRAMTQSKMFRSLTKLTPIIYQDPKEQLPDTPKAGKNPAKSRVISDSKARFFEIQGRQPSLEHIKINSIAFQDHPDDQQAKIQIEQEQTPLNLTQFYQIFRADTDKPRKIQQKLQSIKKKMQISKTAAQKQKLVTIKNFIDKIRKDRVQRAKSMHNLPKTPYTRKQIKISLKKRQSKDKSRSKSRVIQKSFDKSIDSYQDYAKMKVDPKTLPKDSKQLKNIFLALKTKSIPLDLVSAYVKFLENKRPSKSRIFSDFNTNELIRKLSDPFNHSIIFDIETDKQQLVGTIVLSEALGGRAGKLKYQMQFMSVQPFQLVSVAILRVAQELLSTTPCQEVIYPLIVDRLELVSSQFIDLIDADLTEGIQKFGRLAIMQKPRPSLKGTDVRQRMYIFSSESNFKGDRDVRSKMMGNYRSLKFECKCIVLTSNFRLRSDGLFKNTLKKYEKMAIGELFARAIMRFMTKYHLKQLRQASFGGEGELGQVVRTDPFLRYVLAATANDMTLITQDVLKTTNFATMEDLLNYMRYKRYDQHFQLQFLAESRFILKHELTLIELNEEFSLEFTMTSNEQLYMLHNHKNHELTQFNCQKFQNSAYLLPTTHQKLQFFIMSAEHYTTETTDKIDLFSYLSIFFKNISSQTYLNEVPSIVLPNLHQKSTKLSKVRMFDGFFKLFPQRQFYSAAQLNCFNHWQSYYSDAVIHQPLPKSLVFEYPFIIGLYEKQYKILLSAFLYLSSGQSSQLL